MTPDSPHSYPHARRIGVVSDTHGLLRPKVVELLNERVDLILHAGDVGKPEVLEELGRIAPVEAIRGNVDAGLWAEGLPKTLMLTIGAATFYMVHDMNTLDLDPITAEIDVMIFGHSHVPVIETRGSVLYLNPGSIGPKRFSLPISLALLEITAAGELKPRLIEIEE